MIAYRAAFVAGILGLLGASAAQSAPAAPCAYHQPRAGAQPTTGEGWILCFNPPANRYVIRHGTVSSMPRELMGLQSGDEIALRPGAGGSAGAMLPPFIVFTVGGVEMKFDGSASRTFRVPTVPRATPTQHAMEALVDFVRHLMPQFDERPPPPVTAAAAAIQGPGGADATTITIPMLDKQLVLLAAGRRDLQVAWFGGSPPYEVALFRAPEPAPFASLRGVTATHAVFRDVDLRPGTYWLSVAGRGAAPHGAYFRSDPPQQLPQLPADYAAALRTSAESEDFKTTLRSGWLSQQENGAWSLEAYQQLATVSPDFGPARSLRSELENGL